MSVAVLIPALKPSASLLDVIDALAARDEVAGLIVINDGSPPDYDAVFQSAASRPKVTVLRHAVNLGKGSGLKTGINHFLCSFPPDTVLVTADADGQHLPDDILAVAAKAKEKPDALVLGSRAFSGDVPLRSRFGNDVTRGVFRFLVGQKLQDTQTGLRAIPRRLMPDLLRMKSRGYEFELQMLIIAAQHRVPIESVAIQTVYLDDNASSHFNPLLDSMRIYFVFLRFMSSSLVASALDFVIFSAVFGSTHRLGVSMVAARVVSGSLNFAINKRYVFHNRAVWWRSLAGFAVQEALLGGLAMFLIRALMAHGWIAYPAKLAVESILFVCSFAVQRDLIFRRAPEQDDE
jgi:glycosyltransferase involved in cell wall biosynthesis